MDIKIVVFKKDGKQRIFPLKNQVAVVGRRHDCDFQIPLTQVSRRHCKLCIEGEKLKIIDLNSSNGTILNGELLSESAELSAGDVVKIGPVVMAFQIDGVPEDVSLPEWALSKKAKDEEEVSDSGEATQKQKKADAEDDNFLAELDEELASGKLDNAAPGDENMDDLADIFD